MAKIFITGITGFLGSNIGRYLVNNGNDVIATYRSCSSIKLCDDYSDKVTWIMLDYDTWIDEVSKLLPQIIIHAAWIGVSHNERNDWDIQYLNVNYLSQVLNVANKVKADKFIGLGSQAEYGLFNGKIDEDYPLNPNEAYGAVKVICSEIVKQYCSYHSINWYWLRLFSFFGNGEAENWLIPSLVKKILTTTEMDLTPGEQKYAYLYVDDLGIVINNILNKIGRPGIYNISSQKVLLLKNLIERIRDSLNPEFRLNFGALEYRAGQSMYMQGDANNFIKEFGAFEISDFDRALSETVEQLKLTIQK